MDYENGRKELEMLNQQEAFHFVNGVEANSLEEFLEALKIVDSNTFFYHLTNRNDYANWIRGVYSDNVLADKVEMSKDRISIHDLIEQRLEELKGYFFAKRENEINSDEINSLKSELKKELLDLEESLKTNLEKDLEKEIKKDVHNVETEVVKDNNMINSEIVDLESEMSDLKKKLNSTSRSIQRELQEESEDNTILARAVEFLIGVGFGMVIMYIIQRII